MAQQTRKPQQQNDRREPVRERDPQSAAIARVSGTFQLADAINERLAYASQQLHLVSPSTAVGTLPEGCAVALSVVVVDLENETYEVGGGKRALAKSALDKIGGLVGVSWIADQCRRIDNGTDPHYCHFAVAGRYRAFDGQVQTITAHKEMDLRKGSPTIVEIEAQCETHNARDEVRAGKWKRRTPDAQVRQMRQHILAHAESKAKLRAIRSLGVRSNYSPAELKAKPFVCARIMFTGHSANPDLARMFAEKTADAFLSGTHTLYGGGSPAPANRQLPPHAPPALGSPADDDDAPEPEQDEDEDDSHEGEVVDEMDPPPPEDDEPDNQFNIPGGKAKGTPLNRASERDLIYWAERIGRELDEGDSRNVRRDTAIHRALLDEIKVREDAKRGGGKF